MTLYDLTWPKDLVTFSWHIIQTKQEIQARIMAFYIECGCFTLLEITFWSVVGHHWIPMIRNADDASASPASPASTTSITSGVSGCKMSSFAKLNFWLVVWTISKNMKVNGKDYPIYIIYEMENKHVSNHQPDLAHVHLSAACSLCDTWPRLEMFDVFGGSLATWDHHKRTIIRHLQNYLFYEFYMWIQIWKSLVLHGFAEFSISSS